MTDPIPDAERGDHNPGDCPGCGTRLNVVTWQLADPVAPSYLLLFASCPNTECERHGDSIDLEAA